MQVKTIREHINAHRPKPGRKARGDIYSVGVRDGKNLIAAGLVEEVKAEKKTGGQS